MGRRCLECEKEEFIIGGDWMSWDRQVNMAVNLATKADALLRIWYRLLNTRTQFYCSTWSQHQLGILCNRGICSVGFRYGGGKWCCLSPEIL